MNKIIFFSIASLGLISNRLEACQKCYNVIKSLYECIDEEKYRFIKDNPDLDEEFIRTYSLGSKSSLNQALKIIESYHHEYEDKLFTNKD